MNKYLEKLASMRSEFSANMHLADSASAVPKAAHSGIPSGFNTLSKARQAGIKPVAKAGGVLEMVRKARGIL